MAEDLRLQLLISLSYFCFLSFYPYMRPPRRKDKAALCARKLFFVFGIWIQCVPPHGRRQGRGGINRGLVDLAT